MTVEPRFEWRPGERAALPAALEQHAAALARLVIAIDGPGGSGKSTTARAVAGRLGSIFVDTGAMYRALTLAAQRTSTDLADGDALAKLLRAHRIDLEPVRLDGENVGSAVRSPAVTAAVSQVAAHPQVRAEMVARQRQFGTDRGVVLDGRDIGTVVFPHAPLKVFLTAEVRTRAERRQQDDAARGVQHAIEAIEADLLRRDAEDSERSASPLRRATDAILLDTSSMDVAEQIDAVLALAVRTTQPGVQLQIAAPEAWGQENYRPFTSLLFKCIHHALHAFYTVALGQRVKLHPAAKLHGSVLVACNHVAALDPFVAGSALPFESWFIAKLELFKNPFLARFITRVNAIPIRRGTADYVALDRAVQLLQTGHTVFMFPEGTRQTPGRLGTPRWGFGYVAARAGRPIVPVFVRGARDMRPRGLRRQPLEVWIGEPVVARITPGADEHVVFKELGARVMERIAGLMLRSAAGHPLQGLELPGRFASTAVPPERTEAGNPA